MKNLSMKKVLAILIIALIVVSISSVCFANNGYLTIPTAGTSDTAKSLQNVSGIFLSVAQVVGIAVAVIMLIVLAVKYISAAPSDKAEIKKSAVVYVIGAILLFAGSGVLNLVQRAATDINKATVVSMVVYEQKI